MLWSQHGPISLLLVSFVFYIYSFATYKNRSLKWYLNILCTGSPYFSVEVYGKIWDMLQNNIISQLIYVGCLWNPVSLGKHGLLIVFVVLFQIDKPLPCQSSYLRPSPPSLVPQTYLTRALVPLSILSRGTENSKEMLVFWQFLCLTKAQIICVTETSCKQMFGKQNITEWFASIMRQKHGFTYFQHVNVFQGIQGRHAKSVLYLFQLKGVHCLFFNYC